MKRNFFLSLIWNDIYLKENVISELLFSEGGLVPRRKKMMIDLQTVGYIVIIIGVIIAILIAVFGSIDAAPIVMAILSIALLVGGAPVEMNKTSSSKQEDSKLQVEIQDAVDDGYKVYVDGQEVDVDNIDFDQYSIVVDKEKEKIFCSTNGKGIIIKSEIGG